MTRTRRFLDGIFFNYGYQILVMVVGLWLTPFLLAHLGQRDYGSWLIGLQSLTYLTLLDIGIIGLLPREVAYTKGRMGSDGSGGQALRKLIEETLVVVLWQTPVLLLALGVVWCMLPEYGPSFRGAVGCVLIVFAFQFPLRIFTATLEGLQDFAFIGCLQFAAWLLGLAFNVLLILKGAGLYALAGGWAVTQLLLTFCSACRLYKTYPDFMPRRLSWLPWREIAKRLQSGFWVSVAQVAQLLLKGSDVLLIGKFLGPGPVVPYTCSSKLVSVLANQPQVIMHAAQPGLSELRVKADRPHLRSVVSSLAQAMLMMSGLVACVVLSTNEGFVRLWVGPDQYAGFWFTIALLANMLVRHWNTTIVYTLFCFGRERFISAVAIVDGCFVVLFSALFIAKWGLIGVPIGSLVSVLLIGLPANLHALRQETGPHLGKLLLPLGAWLLPFLLVISGLGYAALHMVPNSYFQCGLAAMASSSVYILLEWPVISRSRWGAYLYQTAGALRSRLLGVIRPPITDEVRQTDC